MIRVSVGKAFNHFVEANKMIRVSVGGALEHMIKFI